LDPVLILVLVKFFVLFLLDVSFLHQVGLKLALMRLLGISWSCYLWKYFSWEYGEIYWSFLCISWSSVMVAEFYVVIHTMKEAQKMGLTNVWVGCDSALVCAPFIVTTNVPWMFHNRWNTYLNYCGKIRFRVIHIFREGNMCW